MRAAEALIIAGILEQVAFCLPDRWLADVSLFGNASQVREGIEAWFDSGVKTPIIVPKSAAGGQLQAIQEFFDLWD
mgnify:FL=1